MMNLVIALVMLSAAMMEGVNMSVKPTIIVLEASAASGTCNSSKSGRKGLPKYSKIGVLLANISVIVPVSYTHLDVYKRQGFTELLERYGVKLCVYGHLHGKDAFKNGLKGVFNGVEYRLVSLDYLEGKPALVYSKE